jgi:hypothetical protein
MILNFAPLGLSCWYSDSVEDGVLTGRGFQAVGAKVCFMAFLFRFTVSSLSTLAAYDFLLIYRKKFLVKTL